MDIKSKKSLLQRIANYLMIHSSFCENIGLLYGKLGVAIFYYHYALYCNDELYNNFAGELIDEIYEEISINTPIDFRNGLCGIAWGIEYLIQNKFVNADADEILKDIDIKIRERDVRYINDNSLETGLKGIVYYVISRVSNKRKKNINSVINCEYLDSLTKKLNENCDEDDIEIKKIIILLEQIKKVQSIDCSVSLSIFDFITESELDITDLFIKPRHIGVSQNGYSGIGLWLMKKNNYEKENLYIQSM